MDASVEQDERAAIEHYAIRITPREVWRVLEALSRVDEIGSAALRGAVGMGVGAHRAEQFGRLMTFLREHEAVACRRPAFPGELGESKTARLPWIYRMNDLGRSLLRVHQRGYRAKQEGAEARAGGQ